MMHKSQFHKNWPLWLVLCSRVIYLCTHGILLHHVTFRLVHDALLMNMFRMRMNMFSCLYSSCSKKEARRVQWTQVSAYDASRAPSRIGLNRLESNYSNPAALAPDSVRGVIATTPEKRRNISRSDGGPRTGARGTERWNEKPARDKTGGFLTGNTGNNGLNAQNALVWREKVCVLLPEHESMSRISR